MSGLPMTIVSAVVQCDDLDGLRYLPLNETETTEIRQHLKKILKDNQIDYDNFSVKSKDISFFVNDSNLSKFEKIFFSKTVKPTHYIRS